MDALWGATSARPCLGFLFFPPLPVVSASRVTARQPTLPGAKFPSLAGTSLRGAGLFFSISMCGGGWRERRFPDKAWVSGSAESILGWRTCFIWIVQRGLGLGVGFLLEAARGRKPSWVHAAQSGPDPAEAWAPGPQGLETWAVPFSLWRARKMPALFERPARGGGGAHASFPCPTW